MNNPLEQGLLAAEAKRMKEALADLTPLLRPRQDELPEQTVHALPLNALAGADWTGFVDEQEVAASPDPASALSPLPPTSAANGGSLPEALAHPSTGEALAAETPADRAPVDEPASTEATEAVAPPSTPLPRSLAEQTRVGEIFDSFKWE